MDFPYNSPALAAILSSGLVTQNTYRSLSSPQSPLTPVETLASTALLSLSLFGTSYFFFSTARLFLHSSFAPRTLLPFVFGKLPMPVRKKLLKPMQTFADSASRSYIRETITSALFRSNRFDEALLQLAKSLHESVEYGDGVPTRVVPLSYIGDISEAFRALRKDKQTHVDLLLLARACQDLRHPQKAEDALRIMREKIPGLESGILSALFYDYSGNFAASKALWSSITLSLAARPDLYQLPFGEGINDVYRYGPSEFISGMFVFKRTQAEWEQAHELRLLSTLGSDLGHHADYALPEVLSSMEHRNGGVSYDLVLRYFEGQDYPELRQQGMLKPDDMYKAIDFLFWIYAHSSPEWSAKGPVDFSSKLDSILYGSQLQLPPALADTFASQKELLLGFMEADSPPVLGKDPHPYQWRKGKHQLMALDFDDVGATSMFVDLSKFLVHSKLSLSADELDDLMSFSYQRAKEHGLYSSSETTFRQNLLHAMLYQPLSFAAAWSVPKLEHMRSERAPTLEATETTLDILAQNHGRTGNGYSSLRTSFKGAREHLLTA
jgi:hypothetical protein